MSVGILCLILTLHFVADFLLQPRWMGKNKSEQPAILLLHTCIIQAVMALGLFPFVGVHSAVVFSLCNAVVHGLTDAVSWRGYKWYVKRKYETRKEELLADLGITSIHEYPYWEDELFYITLGADQLLHGLALIVLTGVLL